MKNNKIILSIVFLFFVFAPSLKVRSNASNKKDSDNREIGYIYVPGRIANANDTISPEVKIFSGEPCLLIVNGYSTSVHWWAFLQRKIDRYMEWQAGSKRLVEIQPVARGGIPLMKWMNVKTGERFEVWEQLLTPVIKEESKKLPVIVLAQQTLQGVYEEKRDGIRSVNDTQRIQTGKEILEQYAINLLEDGASAVILAMHIYKKEKEPEIGNERLALKALIKDNPAHIYAGPDVWLPTSQHYPLAFDSDLRHPNFIGTEIMAHYWFEALLKREGLPVPEWSKMEMEDAIKNKPLGLTGDDKIFEQKLNEWHIHRRSPTKKIVSQSTSSIESEKNKVRYREGKIEKDLVYTSINGRDMLLDLYLPEKIPVEPASNNKTELLRPEELVPVVVRIYGGAWRQGEKGDGGLTRRIIERGYALVDINYRLSSESIFPAQIQDCKASIRWVRANASKYNIDPDRIGVMGGSAGGHLAALAGTSCGIDEFETESNKEFSSCVQAVVDLFGPTDFLQRDDQSAGNSRKKWDAPTSAESQLVGGPIQEEPYRSLAVKANPVTYASEDDPPFFIAHGDADIGVPWQQSQLLYDALIKEGVDATLHIMKGVGHGRDEAWKTDEFYRLFADFFDRILKTPE